MAEDYYGILGVGKNASREEIKKAYKILAKKCHPDLNKNDPAATEKFKKINEAAAVLGDPEKRAHYDQFGTADTSRMGGFDFSGFDVGGFDFDDIFENFFGMNLGRSRKRGPKKGQDIRYDLTISFAEAVHGSEKNIKIDRIENCESCKGLGAASRDEIINCPTCNGLGRVKKTMRTPFGIFSQSGTCSSCRGHGTTIRKPCMRCGGDGKERKTKIVKVKIPPGVDEESTLKLKGEGMAGDYGAENGDAYVVLHVEEDEIFEREGDNVYITMPLSFSGAALGTEINVPTVNKKDIKLKIPAGTQTDSIFKVKEYGIKNVGGDGVGDMYVKVVIKTPEKLNKRARGLFEDLAQEDNETLNPEKKRGRKSKSTFFDGWF